jgi:2-methylcitrate dehydratase
MRTDRLLAAMAAHAKHCTVSRRDLDTARIDLMAAFACAFSALRSPHCARLLRPIVPGAVMPGGARVPGTSLELDPVQAAFSIGVLVSESRSLLGTHLGGILSVADYVARKAIMEGGPPPRVRDMLVALVRAQQLQAILAGQNDLGALDDTILTRVASTAIVTCMLGGSVEQITNAVSNAWLDGPLLAVYRQSTGARERWAAADATSRAVRHALLAICGEMGYPTALTARTWGFCDVVLAGQPLHLLREELLARPVAGGTAPDTRMARQQLEAAVDDWFLPRQAERIKAAFAEPQRLDALPVNELMAELVATASNRQGRLLLPLPASP